MVYSIIRPHAQRFKKSEKFWKFLGGKEKNLCQKKVYFGDQIFLTPGGVLSLDRPTIQINEYDLTLHISPFTVFYSAFSHLIHDVCVQHD